MKPLRFSAPYPNVPEIVYAYRGNNRCVGTLNRRGKSWRLARVSNLPTADEVEQLFEEMIAMNDRENDNE